MKRINTLTITLALFVVLAGLIVWNSTAENAAAQKNAEFGAISTLGEYNAKNEFSLTQGGTSGAWSYGYTSGPSSDVFIAYPNTGSFTQCTASPGSDFNGWQDNSVGGVPQIGLNVSASPFFCGSLRVPTDALYLHPGAGLERSVLRWTAPAAGSYRVAGVFEGLDNPGSRDVRILKNATGTPLFSAIVGGQGHQPFEFTVTVATGDTIDFSVGANGSFTFDGTGLSATIGPAPTACLTAPANLQVNVPAENSPSDVASANPNASLVGDATYTNMGKAGRAFDLDGNGDYVRIEDNLAQRPATAVTVEGWFKFDSAPGIVSLISKPLRNSSLNSYTLYMDGGQLRGLVSNGPQYTRAFSSYTPPVGVWQHLAFTYDLTGGVSRLRLFANGIEITTGQDGTPNIPMVYDANPYPLLIGGEFENNAAAFFLDGQADEVSVYGHALSQTEIFNLVKSGSLGKCASQNCVQSQQGLVSWLKGEGNALDSKGSNNGTTSGVTFSAGKVGLAFDFNGNAGNFVGAGTSLMNAGTADFAVDFWMQTSNNRLEQVIGKRNGCAGGEPPFFNIRKLPNGRLNVELDSASGQRVAFDSNLIITDGAFHHITVQRVGNSLQLYIDGVRDNSATGVAGINLSNIGQFAIGGLSCAGVDGTQTFTGKIDEVSVYSRALTPTEIQSFFFAGSNGKCDSASCVQSPNNLVSWFAAEGNAIDSKSGNHGTLQNGAAIGVGKVGQAFSFDSNDRVVMPNSPSLDITGNQLTIEAWINPTVVTGDRQIVSMASGTAIPNDRKFGLFIQNQKLGVEVRTSNAYFGSVPTDGDLFPNVFTHVALVYDGTQIIKYINGVAVGAPVAITGNIVANSGDFSIGQFATGGFSSYEGLIDEVGVYNRGLSAAEIQAIYTAGSSGKCKPVAPAPASNQIAWFTGDGDARDLTGLNTTGTLQGDASYRVGKVGQAFNLDGSDDYVTTADSPNWDFGTGDFAIESWFNAASPTGVQRIISAGAMSDGANNLWALGIGDIGAWGGGQRINFAVFNGSGYNDLSSNPLQFAAGTWHHVAVVRSGTTMNFYLDGASVGSVAIGAGFAVNGGSTGAIIGARYNNNPSLIFEFMNGRIDEVGVYNRALSAAEISAIYGAGSTGKAKSATAPVNFAAEVKRPANLAPSVVQVGDATVTFAQVTSAGSVTQSGIDLGSLPALPTVATATGLAYEISTTAAYQNGSPDDVQVCFNVPALANLTFANLRILHLENGAWVNRTATGNASPNICTDNLSSLSPFVIVQLAPTSAQVSVGGRVTTADGRGIRNAVVTMTDASGNSRTARTGSFGRYVFESVGVGEVYFVTVTAKKWDFPVATRAVSPDATMDDVDFVAAADR